MNVSQTKCDGCGRVGVSNPSRITNLPNSWLCVIGSSSADFCSVECLANWATARLRDGEQKKEAASHE